MTTRHLAIRWNNVGSQYRNEAYKDLNAGNVASAFGNFWLATIEMTRFETWAKEHKDAQYMKAADAAQPDLDELYNAILSVLSQAEEQGIDVDPDRW
jgi:hypothetical protein